MRFINNVVQKLNKVFMVIFYLCLTKFLGHHNILYLYYYSYFFFFIIIVIILLALIYTNQKKLSLPPDCHSHGFSLKKPNTYQTMSSRETFGFRLVVRVSADCTGKIC